MVNVARIVPEVKSSLQFIFCEKQLLLSFSLLLILSDSLHLFCCKCPVKSSVTGIKHFFSGQQFINDLIVAICVLLYACFSFQMQNDPNHPAQQRKTVAKKRMEITVALYLSAALLVVLEVQTLLVLFIGI